MVKHLIQVTLRFNVSCRSKENLNHNDVIGILKKYFYFIKATNVQELALLMGKFLQFSNYVFSQQL